MRWRSRRGRLFPSDSELASQARIPAGSRRDTGPEDPA